MKYTHTVAGVTVLLVLACTSAVFAQGDTSIEEPAALSPLTELNERFYRGEVIEIIQEYQEEFGLSGARPITQRVRTRFTQGERVDQDVEVEYGALTDRQKLKVGDGVVLIETGGQIYVFDKYRLGSLGFLGAVFVLLAIAFAGWRGATSLIGLVVSVLVLTLYVVPSIIEGKNPLIVSFFGSVVIAFVSIYLAHGFTRRTTVAVVSTLATIILAFGLAQTAVGLVDLTGTGSEEAYFLQTSPISFVNLRGLLLGGMIIGALGVLDDITTAQSAAVAEISRANPKLTRRQLFARGAAVGKEHITSLINTLALAYVGASFPALLLFTVYQRPWWVVANTEAIAEEVVRTLVGSVALMVAVPITTFLAAYVATRFRSEPIQ